MGTKRLRIFAGPNGSGKSTITKIVEAAGIHLGVYINADDLKRTINTSLYFDFSSFLEHFDPTCFWRCFSSSSLFDLANGSSLCAGSKVSVTSFVFQNRSMTILHLFWLLFCATNYWEVVRR